MNILIIAEKPSVALRIASSLGSGAPEKRQGAGKASYYEMKNGKETIYVAAAVGHIFTVHQVGNQRGYPVLDVEWAPSYKVSKTALFTKDYFDTLKEVAGKCETFINACDYDIEGTVIGTNIIKFMKKGKPEEGSKRMKFSTTTSKDLQEAYKSLTKLDMNNFYAGETRHIIDWLWGINLSRALSGALNRRGKESLSIGRVQGPALAILANKEKEIGKFVSRPFWRVIAVVGGVEMTNSRGDIFEREVADRALSESSGKKSASIDKVDKTNESVRPPPPFDLTTLQLEASRALRLDPTMTLSVAQSLYERSYISYPRTSSQKLPASLGLEGIIKSMAGIPGYRELAGLLVKEKRFKPNEGAKNDEAHPSIFPTGVEPKGMNDLEGKVYDIIARRFLSCFAADAEFAKVKISARIGGERYSAQGKRMLTRGWLDFYTHARIDEALLPEFEEGKGADVTSVEMKESKTQPPKRYSKAGIIAELERRDLGTKATRAAIVDTLFKRTYVEGPSIKVTKFGMSVYEALAKNCEMIVDEGTTRKLEEEMGEISKGKKSEGEVVEEGKKMLLEALKMFDDHRLQIAESMQQSIRSMSVLGKCPRDGGDLVIRFSKIGKRFAGCSNYPNCTATYPLPQKAKIAVTGRSCEVCKAPIIRIILGRGREFESDLDTSCKENIARAPWKAKAAATAIAAEEPAKGAAPEAAAEKKEGGAKKRAEKKADTADTAARAEKKPAKRKAAKKGE